MDTPFEPLFFDAKAQDYALWLKELKPRTCLLMHWLANIEAVIEPGHQVRRTARRFADKRQLLGRIVDEAQSETSDKTLWLLHHGEFDLYVAWLMWLRFLEYVPERFVLPTGRQKVLGWVREQLRRPELTDAETLGELHWQVERLRSEWGEIKDCPNDHLK